MAIYQVTTESEAKDTMPVPQTPALVTTTKGVTLADKLRLSDLPLATTPGGKAFSLKALHPSEHTVKSTKVPGGNELSVALCSDQIFEIPIVQNNASVWITQTANIVAPVTVTKWDQGVNTYWTCYSSAFGGTDQIGPTVADTKTFLQRLPPISKYRITAQSVTAELIANALADQGSVLSVQADNLPITLQMSTPNVLGSSATGLDVWKDMFIFPTIPSINSSILGSSAYSAKAKEGVYQPLKLRSFKWKNFNDMCIMETHPAATIHFSHWQMPGTTNLEFPYHENRAAVSDLTDLVPVPKPCGFSYGHIKFAGLAGGASVRVRVRQCLEIVVPPGSTYAPMCDMPLPPDETALRMYFEISSRMKDGYPAYYNSIGKLVDTIKSIGKTLLPYVDPALDAISKIPGPVGDIAMIAKDAKPLIQKGAQVVMDIRRRRKARKAKGKKDQPPALPPRNLPPVPAGIKIVS